MNATNKMRQGFTLIELLVVVAIIAVIGAGVAVTYRNLDAKAKTAMEMSDCSILQKVIKHWSFINDYKLPNKLDSLIDLNDDKLYSQMPSTSGSYTISGIDNNETIGLYGPAGYTFKVETAPTIVLDNLAAAGLTLVYKHDTTRSPANDSTFTTGTMGAEVITTDTLYSLDSDRASAQAIVDAQANEPEVYSGDVAENEGKYVDSDGNVAPFVVNGVSYATKARYQAAYNTALETLNAQSMDKLAFIYPGAGAKMMGMVMAMNLTYEIISNIGLVPDDVALPSEDAATASARGAKYYLCVFGLGRFASIYSGKGVRADTPAVGKRYPQTANNYSRYLIVVKVPVESYNGMYGSSEAPSVACVLTPNGYCPAALRDTYQSDEDKVRDVD